MGPFMYRRRVHWGAKWIDRVICRDAVWINSCTIHLNKQGSSCNGNLSFDPMDDIKICCALLSQCDIELPAFICRSWKSSRTMTLVDAPECTAVVSPAFQQDNQIFLDRAQWKYIVRNVKNFTIQDPSTKAVSFWPILSLFWYDISIIPFTSAEWRVALLCCSFQVIYILTTLLNYWCIFFFAMLCFLSSPCQQPSITLSISLHYYLPPLLLFFFRKLFLVNIRW